MCGENTAKKYSIGREEQDRYAIQSYSRSQEAAKRGAFNDEIEPITVKTRKSCMLASSRYLHDSSLVSLVSILSAVQRVFYTWVS